MSQFAIATRYASSLLQLAEESNQLEKVHDDVNLILDACKTPELLRALKSPIINSAKKSDIVNALFKDKVTPLSLNFAQLLVTKGREDALSEILSAFLDLYREKKQISTAKVTSAVALTEENLKTIKEQLAASGFTHKNIELETAIDESLIGGFVIEVGDKLFDSSIATQLQKIKKALVS